MNKRVIIRAHPESVTRKEWMDAESRAQRIANRTGERVQIFYRNGLYYGAAFPKSNPGGRKLTKAQKKEKTRKASAKRRVAVALAKYLKQQNPSMKAVGAKVQKLKGGVLKITPIKAKPKKIKRYKR